MKRSNRYLLLPLFNDPAENQLILYSTAIDDYNKSQNILWEFIL